MAHFIRNIIRKVGYDLVKYNSHNRLPQSLVTFLKNQHVDVVFDIGANTGQYAYELIQRGYRKKIVSFEPLTSAHEELVKVSSKFNNWIIANRCAIGNENRKSKINIANNSESSSILPMLDNHIKSAPESYYIGFEEVDMSNLDTAIKQYAKNDKNIFIKLDVQGYEFSILENLNEGFDKVIGLQIETSIIPLYEGEIIFDKMVSYVIGSGFKLYDIIPAYRDKNSKRLLQMDCIFFKDT